MIRGLLKQRVRSLDVASFTTVAEIEQQHICKEEKMNIISERQEIAAVMNFGKYPVLGLDMSNKPYNEYDNFIVGSKVRVAWDRKDPRWEGMTSRCFRSYFRCGTSTRLPDREPCHARFQFLARLCRLISDCFYLPSFPPLYEVSYFLHFFIAKIFQGCYCHALGINYEEFCEEAEG